MVAVVDSHTCGEPTRIVIGGAPIFRGASMAEKSASMNTDPGAGISAVRII
nr:proline racemase family protein [Cloacibacillus evryensis]